MKSNKEVRFSVQMKTVYMFDFLYWHSYHGITGIINYALSFAGIAALIAGFGKGLSDENILHNSPPFP